MGKVALALVLAGMLPGRAPAIDSQSHPSIAVAENHGECIAAGHSVACLDLPRLLRNLGIGPASPIVVSPRDTDQEAFSRAQDVVAILKSGGFSNVSISGFLTAPESDPSKEPR